MHSVVGLWRWRGNPLCRRSDRREAWLALWTAVVITVGAPLTGWCTADRIHDALVATAHRQHLERRAVWATAEEAVLRPRADPDPESASRSDYRPPVVARWTGPDGSSHRGTVRTDSRVRAGDRFRIWTNLRGRIARPPVTTRTATAHGALGGLAAAAAAVLTVEAARRLALGRSMRRRYARWDAEWQRIGPDWGRAGSSN